MPCAEVCPAEVAFHHADIFALLQHALVYRQVGVGGVVFVDECHLLFNGVMFQFTVEALQHIREQPAETDVQIAGVGQDDSCVPQKLARVHKHLGEVALWFLDERLYVADLCHLHNFWHN